MSELFVDARGLRCPWPVLRLARAMRGSDRVAIAADDPQAPAELRALAEEQGWSIEARADDFLVTRRREDGSLTGSSA